MPQRARCLDVARRNGLDSGPERLGEIAAVDEAQAITAETNGLNSKRCAASVPISSGSTKCTQTTMT